ncbi:unnamed protein product [Rhizoctonia solani]|uniref:Alphaherpesvirus glycoprotein E domain protein n=1 Tax=Rhizoctonia solani TaxID=456999 RepID=A0A8H3CY43_9AGAM|nr:unnamed protein product [Rhizoctonia solani]
MIPRHFSVLLALSALCHAWRANFSESTQCGTGTVTWSATAAESIGPPFVVRMAAFGLAPLIFNLPASAWSDSSRTGSYSYTVPWPAGTQFLSVMDDGFGSGTGGISGIQTVTPSSNSTCINSTITEPSRVFDIYSSFVQCSTVSMNWTEPATSQTRITGLVPNGIAFQLDSPLTGSKSTTWDLNIEAGTAFVLIYGGASGNGMTSPLLQSLGSSITGCLASGAYPSATAPQTGVAQVTVTGTPIPWATPSASSPEPSESNSRSNLGPILGAVFGVLALLGVLGVGVCVTLRRRRHKQVVPQTPGLAKEVDLDAENLQSTQQFNRNHFGAGPYHPEGAVILPFVLPSNMFQQGLSSINPPKLSVTTGPHGPINLLFFSTSSLIPPIVRKLITPLLIYSGFVENAASNPPRKGARHETSGDTVNAGDSSQVYGTTSTSASQSTPGFRSDDEPMIIRHEDAGAIIPARTREVIELPPGYDQLPRSLPLTQTPQEARPHPTPSQKLTVSN